MSGAHGSSLPDAAPAPAPTVSVVMAVHNEERYLRSAVDSILVQDFRNFEFIIIDDASTDATPDMLRDFARRDDRIRILSNAENLSVPRSLNRGLDAARGRYIARMDGDDISLPHRLSEQVRFLDANPDFVLVGGGAEYIDADGKVTKRFVAGATPWEFDWISIFRPPLLHPSAMYRAALVRDNNERYDPACDRAEDFEFWHRLLRHGKGCELPGVYVRYRVHEANVSTTHSIKQRQIANCAGKKNARARFQDIPEPSIDALFNFLFNADERQSADLREAIELVGTLQSRYIREENLTPSQARDIRRRTAKLLIKKAMRQRASKKAGDLTGVLSLIAQYLPEYCAETIHIARRRYSNAA